jgi:hypothetical protein
MAQTKIFDIPGKLSVAWDSEAKAIVDTWTSYNVTKDQFSNAVLNKGLAHARANGGVAYIVDSSQAEGTFSQEIQDFIGSDIFPAFAKANIKYFITILSKSVVTNMGIKRYSAKVGPLGIQLVNVDSLRSAVDWLSKNAH